MYRYKFSSKKEITEKIKIIKKYLEIVEEDPIAKERLNFLKTVEKLNLLPENYWRFYPKIKDGKFYINKFFHVTTHVDLFNPTTGYNFKDGTDMIVGCFSGGALNFVDVPYWEATVEEYNEFEQALIAHKPLDYDLLNHMFVYDIETGRKVIQDYPAIKTELMEKCKKKIKEVDIENDKRRLEELKQKLAKM